MFFELRPVGNRIRLASTPFDTELLAPFSFIGFDSGTSALAEVLIALRKERPEVKHPKVFLPAYTCPDIVSSCLYANVEPILIDFDTNSTWMCLSELNRKIDESTLAIIAINFLGIPERIKEIRKLVDSRKITIIEDSAQGFPIKKLEKYWSGDVVIVSFGRGKPLNLLGGGGVLIDLKGKNKVLGKQIELRQKKLPISGNTFIYRLKVIIFNIISLPFFYYFLTKLPFLSLGSTIYHQLDNTAQLPKDTKNQISVNYKKYVSKPSLRSAYDDMFITLNTDIFVSLPINSKLESSFPLLRYPILILDEKVRNKIYEQLLKEGLGVSSMYKKTLPNIHGVKELLNGPVKTFPNADLLSLSLLTLPMHEDVKQKHIKKIQDIFLNCQ